MYKTCNIWPKAIWFIALVCLFQLAAPLAWSAPMLPGVVRVVKLVGIVSATNRSTEVVQELSTGDRIAENYLVEVGPESSVVLLFSNGATLSLTENTRLTIDEFLQTPFQSRKTNLAQVNQEPSSSKTRLFVNYGTVRGSVKQLNTKGGSRYDIGSPIGIAGIRGTTFELVISESGSDYTGSFTVGEGSAFFISKSNNYLPLDSNSEVEVTTSDTGETLTSSNIDPTTEAALSSATSDAVDSFNDFSSTEFDPTTIIEDTSTGDASLVDGGADSSGTGSSADSGSSSDSGTSDSTATAADGGTPVGGTSSTKGGSSGSSTTTESSDSDAGAPPAQAEEITTEPQTLPVTQEPSTQTGS